MKILDIYVNSVRELRHPDRSYTQPLLLKFIESKITGEAKDRFLARIERNTWSRLELYLRKIMLQEELLDVMQAYCLALDRE
jgi:hypothetical protein